MCWELKVRLSVYLLSADKNLTFQAVSQKNQPSINTTCIWNVDEARLPGSEVSNFCRPTRHRGGWAFFVLGETNAKLTNKYYQTAFSFPAMPRKRTKTSCRKSGTFQRSPWRNVNNERTFELLKLFQLKLGKTLLTLSAATCFSWLACC